MPNELSLSDIPDEILVQIFLFLNLESLFHLNFVSKKIKQKINSANFDIMYKDAAFNDKIQQIKKIIIDSKDHWNQYYEDLQRTKEYYRALDKYRKTKERLQVQTAHLYLQDISVIADTSKYKYIHSFNQPNPMFELFAIASTMLILFLAEVNVIFSIVLIALGLGIAKHVKNFYNNKKLISEQKDVQKDIKTGFLENKDFRHCRKLYLIKNHFWKKYEEIKKSQKNTEEDVINDEDNIKNKFEELEELEPIIRNDTPWNRFQEIMDEFDNKPCRLG